MFVYKYRPAGGDTWVKQRRDGVLVAENSQPSPIGAYSAYAPTWSAEFVWPAGVVNDPESSVSPMRGEDLWVLLRRRNGWLRPFCLFTAVFCLLMDVLIGGLFVGLLAEGQWPAVVFGPIGVVLVGWIGFKIGWRNDIAPNAARRGRQREDFLRELGLLTGATIRVQSQGSERVHPVA